MGKQGYTSELQRALNRPDIAEIERLVDSHFVFVKNNNSKTFDDQHFDAWNWLARGDPDKALATVMIAASRYDDPWFECMVAVSMLEDMLRDPSDEILNRIVVEARKTPRLRWMLSAVFRHAMSTKARTAIEPIVGSLTSDDPLPPAPTA